MTIRQVRRKGKRIKKLSYEQKRRAYRTYSNAQRGGYNRKMPEKDTERSRRSRIGQTWQLVVSAVILITVVAVKLTAPRTFEPLRGQLLDLIGRETDFVEVFSSVGRAVGVENGWKEVLNDAYVAVFGTQSAENEDGEPNSGTAPNQAYSRDQIPDNACLSQKILGFAYASPLAGTVSDGFGYRQHPIDESSKFHYGLDMEAEEGAVIASFADGTVTAVGESSVLGKYITVQHENGYATLYAHCSRVTASSGQQVRLGDPIAEVGRTGQTTGPHLHFELHQDTLYLNPIYYV